MPLSSNSIIQAYTSPLVFGSDSAPVRKGLGMSFSRRKFLRLAAGAAALLGFSSKASAQSYPTRTVRVIVAVAAGGSPDIVARLMGQWLSKRLGLPFVIENRPGAGGNIGTEVVVKASPDGIRSYSLLCRTRSMRHSTRKDSRLISLVTSRRSEVSAGDSMSWL